MNKIAVGVIAVLVLAVGALAYKNYQLSQKLASLEITAPETKEEVTITPVEVKEPSPFDKPHNDPTEQINPVKPDLPPDSPPAAPLTNVKFDKMAHDFGRIAEGVKVRTKFKFTNTGPNPLIISKCVGSCGCTVPKWPKEPIPSGKSGEIEVEFDSAHKSGEQGKTVTVSANTSPSSYILSIHSVVVPKND
jgi:hypothetical protein